MARKKRIFQVAREFNISNEALLGFLIKLNFDVRNQMSTISEEAYGVVRDKFGIGISALDENFEFRKKLKEKREKDADKKEAERRKLEERIQASKEVAVEMEQLKKKAAEDAKAAAAKAKKQMEKADLDEATEPKKIVKKRKKIIKVIELKPTKEPKKGKEIPEKKKEEEEKPKVEEKVTAKTRRRRRKKVGDRVGEPVEVKKDEKTEPAGDEKAKKKRRRRRRKRGEGEVAESRATETRRRIQKRKKPRFNDEEINEKIKETLSQIDGVKKDRYHKRKKKETGEDEFVDENLLRVHEFVSAGELAELMDADASEVLQTCIELGMMVSINQRLDADTIILLAAEFDYDVEIVRDYGAESMEVEEEDESLLEQRPPIVTIMGHVDHGKTSLLDFIRNSNILSQESGGITQHIGAYEVFIDSKAITFLDTPGHEAFTAMRARGAQVTDIVVLVVAADDSVMPQTIEAINHAKAAGVSIIVAINKIDKPSANPELIRKQLSENGVLIEEWGGKYQCVEISAKFGNGVDKLLELILLEAEVMELQANPNRLATGVVIESRLDKGKGVIATVLIQKGTLKIGDPYISGQHSGKVRSMFDELGRRVKSAGPSIPVAVLGFNGIPEAGDTFQVLESERDSKEISQKRQYLRREKDQRRLRPSSLDQISKQIKRGDIKELLIVLKGDVTGSIEAIADSLAELSNDEVAIKVIHKGAGAITESDVLLATASGAIIIGFHVRPTLNARELAKLNNVDIRLYNVIYDIKEDMKNALEGFLKPHIREQLTGTIEVRQVFKVPRIGMVAGCYVLSGKIIRNDRAKIYRNDKLIHDGRIGSLKRFKDDVKEVPTGFECGLGFERYADIKVSDIIETYNIIEEKRTL